MNKRIKKLWIKALRSGKYKQGTGQLRRGRKPENVRHCCLGVLEELAVQDGCIKRFRGTHGFLEEKVRAWAGLDSINPQLGNQPAAYLNDMGYDFAKIANRIEKYL